MTKQKRAGHGITILDSQDRLFPVVDEILDLIRSYDMILSTGHLSTREIYVLLDAAEKKKIDKIVITRAGLGAMEGFCQRLIEDIHHQCGFS